MILVSCTRHDARKHTWIKMEEGRLESSAQMAGHLSRAGDFAIRRQVVVLLDLHGVSLIAWHLARYGVGCCRRCTSHMVVAGCRGGVCTWISSWSGQHQLWL